MPSILSSHVLLHWVHPSFACNPRGYANVDTEILSPLACKFIKNGSLSLIFLKDYVIFLGTAILSDTSEWLLLYLYLSFWYHPEMLFLCWFKIVEDTEAVVDR